MAVSPNPTTDDPADAPAIVAITGSAVATGSLTALLERLPPQDGAVLAVVVQNREVLDEDALRAAAARAGYALADLADGAPIVGGDAWLSPAGVIATIADGCFRTHPAEHVPNGRGTIDSFLVSLAQAGGPRAIVVALDGTDGDGTLGVREVKEAGGLVLAEAVAPPEDLAQSDKPAALADDVLPVEELPARIAALVEQVRQAQLPDSPLAPSPDQPEVREALTAIAGILRQKTGHDFHGYKPGTFLRRVQRRCQALLLDGLPAYVEFLRNQPGEAQELFNDLLIGGTEFFRDRREWEVLEREVIPRLLEGKTAQDTVRIWVVGCSTGEEAYSLAILLREGMAQLDAAPHVQIFASDLDGRALAVARAGRYTDSIVGQMSPERLARWFVREGDTWHITKELREMCVFSQHSLIKDAPFSRIDLISCRNLLIYLDAELQEQVIPLFHFALRPGGWLFLGNSENVSRHTALFEPAVEGRSRIFRRLETASRPVLNFPFTPVDRRTLPPTGTGSPGEPPRQDAADLTRWAERAVERHSPAWVITDAGYRVLHFAGNIGRYLAPSRGAASLDLLQLIHPHLRLELRAALARAAEEGQAAEARGLPVGTNGGRIAVDLVVEPRLPTAEGSAGFLVILKDRGPRSETEAPDSTLAAADQAEVVRRLEDELRVTRDRLQSTIEELESTNEELKSSNEEYQSLNEELQSANEEPETSKEELQSINEELTTVNGELGHRVQELGRANSDLKNFLESTQIATLFLDNDLRVTNFTPAIMDLYPLVDSDKGRPIADIKSRVVYDELPDDARRVLRTLAPVEREVGGPATRAQYAVRVLPYRSTDNVIAGVVVTFVDITARRQIEERLRESEARLAADLAGMRRLHDLRARVATETDLRTALGEILLAACDFTGTDRGWVQLVGPDGRRMETFIARGYAEHSPLLARLRRGGLEQGGEVARAERRRMIVEDAGALPGMDEGDRAALRAEGVMAMQCTPMISRSGEVVGVLGTQFREARRPGDAELRLVDLLAWAAADFVERHRAIEALRESEERFRAIVETARDYAIFTTEPDGRIAAWPPGAEEVFGWTPAEAVGQPVDLTFTPEDRAAGVPQAERREAQDKGVAGDVRWHLRKDGGRVFIEGVVRPFAGPDGEIKGFVKIGRDVTERRATEAALRESEARFRQFGDNSADVLWIRSAGTLDFEYISPAAQGLYGVGPDDLVGEANRRWAEAIVPDDREAVLDNLGRVAAGEQVLQTFRVRRPDGEVRWVRDTSFPLRDEAGRVQRIGGIGHDATDEVELQDRLKVLVAELQHRSRNLVGVVKGVAERTIATSTSLEEFRTRFRARLQALARVNSLLSRLEEGERITFDQLLLAELAAHGVVNEDGEGRQVRLSGPKRLPLRSSTVQTFALAIHELATNALKYGALSVPDGRLEVSWSVLDGAGDDTCLQVKWRERGVPPSPADERPAQGYGRELIERALPYQLKAETSYELTPEGVDCVITVPLASAPEVAFSGGVGPA